MKVMCDDQTTIYLDGIEQKNVAGTGNYNEMATLQIPASTKVVGVECYNMQGAYGIKVEIRAADGTLVTSTGSSWECSTEVQDGWSSAGFGGTWSAAFTTDQHSNWKNLFSGSVVWTQKVLSVQTVYCRKVVPKL